MSEKLLDVNSSVYTNETATPKMQAPSPVGSGSKAPKAKEMDVNKGGYTDEKGTEGKDHRAFKM